MVGSYFSTPNLFVDFIINRINATFCGVNSVNSDFRENALYNDDGRRWLTDDKRLHHGNSFVATEKQS